MSRTLVRGPGGVEMTSDPRFAGRVRRLVAVSAVALGVIFVLAIDSVGGARGAAAMIGLGWVTMPTILASSLRRPRLRYLLAVPSTLVSVGVLFTSLGFDGPGLALAGWWSIAVGIAMGAGMGMWLWFRWMPVPRRFDAPFSAARWSLVWIHVTFIVAGILLVFFGAVL